MAANSDAQTHADWLREEPFTLALSAGFFGFFAHAGVLRALEDRKLRPARVVGASAGALSGGLWAAGVPGERLGEFLEQLEREDFWDPGAPIGGLLKGQKFARILRELLPAGVEHIEHCPLPFAAVAHDPLRRRTEVISRGPLEPAIRASCAVPLFFRPVRVQGRWMVDGGVSDRSSLSAVADDERCLYHHLPHRSPWPRIDASARTELAVTERRKVLMCETLPKVHPFALERGRVALVRARERARAWLDEPVVGD